MPLMPTCITAPLLGELLDSYLDSVRCSKVPAVSPTSNHVCVSWASVTCKQSDKDMLLDSLVPASLHLHSQMFPSYTFVHSLTLKSSKAVFLFLLLRNVFSSVTFIIVSVCWSINGKLFSNNYPLTQLSGRALRDTVAALHKSPAFPSLRTVSVSKQDLFLFPSSSQPRRCSDRLWLSSPSLFYGSLGLGTRRGIGVSWDCPLLSGLSLLLWPRPLFSAQKLSPSGGPVHPLK